MKFLTRTNTVESLLEEIVLDIPIFRKLDRMLGNYFLFYSRSKPKRQLKHVYLNPKYLKVLTHSRERFIVEVIVVKNPKFLDQKVQVERI